MKTYFLGIMTVVTLVSSCNSDNSKQIERKPSEHNAKNTLDVDGKYVGVLPCADCEGIETSIILSPENAFVLETNYLGFEDNKHRKISGKYTWNELGNTIILEGIDVPNQYFVGENQLFHLDMEGKKITGDLAEKYILKKTIKNNKKQ